jgi:hypothetical protein
MLHCIYKNKQACILALFFMLVFFHAPITTGDVWGISGSMKVAAQNGEIKPPDQNNSGHTTESLKTVAEARTTENNKPADTSWMGSLATAIFSWFGNIILWIFSLLAGVTGLLLEGVANQLVFQMGNWIGKGSSVGASIDLLWAVIRDICNLAFIFGFIYIGITTIINPDSYSVKRFLSRIIIGALLINFSLFFVKIIIDFSNFLTIKIFQALTTSSTGEISSISAKIADVLGIATIFKVPDPATFAGMTGPGAVTFYIFAAILLLIVAFVFLAAAILLINRFVALVLIMIASPILFAATVFPQTEHYASDLWKKLISYSFFAPAYFLCTLLSLTILESLTKLPGYSSDLLAPIHAGIKGGQVSGVFGVMLFFAIAIALLWYSITIPRSLGIAGGDMVVDMSKRLRGAIGGTTFGMAGRLGRATFGRWAHSYADRDDLKDKASQKGWGGFVARRKLDASRYVADSSFDARGTAAGKGLGLGDARKGGYESVLKEVKEKEEKFAKSLGEVGDDDVRVLTRKKQMEKEQANLRRLEEELKKIPTSDVEARTKMRETIEHKKHDIHEAKVLYESEKQRRMIGSTFTEDAITKTQGDELEQLTKAQTNAKEALDKKWKESGTNPTREQRNEIQNLMKSLKEAKKAKEKFVNTLGDGYAGVLENGAWWNTWPKGRMVHMEVAAGEAIRKARKDGLPKEKDHGHGEGEHGGGDHGGDDHDEGDHGHDEKSHASPIIVPFSAGGGPRKSADHGGGGDHGHGGGHGH